MRTSVISLGVGLLLASVAIVRPFPAVLEAPHASAAAGAPSGQIELTGDGRSAPGPYFLGRPDAPLTIVEYADFQ